MIPTLSIVIPYYDPKWQTFRMLKELCQSIASQTISPNEVIISSSHDLPQIDELVAVFNKTVDFRVFRSTPGGAAENINQVIRHASGEIVKIMFHDDLFYSEESLEQCYQSLTASTRSWLICGSANFYDGDASNLRNFIKPRVGGLLHRGFNTIGAPSVVIFRRSDFLDFATNIQFLYDCDWYLSMLHNVGEPKILESTEVLVRIHSNQATNSVRSLRRLESKYVAKRHPFEIAKWVLATKFGKEVNCVCQIRKISS